MKLQARFASITALMICLLTAGFVTSMADHNQRGGSLGALKRAIIQANAPALTAQQETDLTTLITNFRNAQPTGPDAALEAARDAYDAAILAGDLAAATAQAAIIVRRTAELLNTRLQAEAKFEIDVLANLRAGGQLDALTQKFSSERVLSIVGSLIGRGGFGGGPHGGR